MSAAPGPINYESQVLTLGSCFAQHMGDKLHYFKFRNLINPMGIVFHPIAMERLITRAINQKVYTEADLFYHKELWHCFETHSSFSGPDQSEVLSVLNLALTELGSWLSKASHIICTYGTAWVYRHIATDQVVANCHKLPQKRFLKELLSPNEIAASLDRMQVLIRQVNPTVTLIHTVSPVRHLKDGMVANSQSKAHLLSGIHQQVEPRKRSHYFPSYELMMDELRDYRYYEADMLHPNAVAIQYIWERFHSVWIDQQAQPTLDQILKIQQALAHKPFHPNSSEYRDFRDHLDKQIANIQAQFPHIIFE